jgi:hypothetical protein
MYKEMKKIVEVRNKHGNGDEILDFADLFFSLASKMLGSAVKFYGLSVDRKHTYFFFGLSGEPPHSRKYYFLNMVKTNIPLKLMQRKPY